MFRKGRLRAAFSFPEADVATAEEIELRPVVAFFRGELRRFLVIAPCRGQIADGFGHRAEVEVERSGLAMTDRGGLPDGARVLKAIGADHGKRFFERRRVLIELD